MIVKHYCVILGKKKRNTDDTRPWVVQGEKGHSTVGTYGAGLGYNKEDALTSLETMRRNNPECEYHLGVIAWDDGT